MAQIADTQIAVTTVTAASAEHTVPSLIEGVPKRRSLLWTERVTFAVMGKEDVAIWPAKCKPSLSPTTSLNRIAQEYRLTISWRSRIWPNPYWLWLWKKKIGIVNVDQIYGDKVVQEHELDPIDHRQKLVSPIDHRQKLVHLTAREVANSSVPFDRGKMNPCVDQIDPSRWGGGMPSQPLARPVVITPDSISRCRPRKKKRNPLEYSGKLASNSPRRSRGMNHETSIVSKNAARSASTTKPRARSMSKLNVCHNSTARCGGGIRYAKSVGIAGFITDSISGYEGWKKMLLLSLMITMGALRWKKILLLSLMMTMGALRWKISTTFGI